MQTGGGDLRLKKYRDELIKREERKLKKLERAQMAAKKKDLKTNLNKIMNPEVSGEGSTSKVQFFNARSRKHAQQPETAREGNDARTRTKDTFEEFKRQAVLRPDSARLVP